MPYSKSFPNPGIKSQSPTLQADSLPAEPPGKPNLCTGDIKTELIVQKKKKKKKIGGIDNKMKRNIYYL